MKNNSMDILKKFGTRIQFLRKKQRISQEELAHICGLHRTYIGMIERGEKNITLKNIEKLANALKLNISDLIKDLNG
ncbi:helix-turn-helix transcriptional regulator [Arcobacter sp. 15-2]|uniref:helix-turn-helix domain-containing protein n=1 Tax=Arcobacter sp. 15-2 TaxID=3374109 RepID=UPI00399D344E